MPICAWAVASPSGPWLEPVPSSLGTPLVQKNAADFGRPAFRCSEGSALYLVRAAYLNGGTGEFKLWWVGTARVVAHASLGGPPI
jgi:hypothetical protein